VNPAVNRAHYPDSARPQHRQSLFKVIHDYSGLKYSVLVYVALRCWRCSAQWQRIVILN
jgi:hypothetical protein